MRFHGDRFRPGIRPAADESRYYCAAVRELRRLYWYFLGMSWRVRGPGRSAVSKAGLRGMRRAQDRVDIGPARPARASTHSTGRGGPEMDRIDGAAGTET